MARYDMGTDCPDDDLGLRRASQEELVNVLAGADLTLVDAENIIGALPEENDLAAQFIRDHGCPRRTGEGEWIN